jgi:predicted lysophospholipase L1 biosynthesis ABC-type transport system permease subunit
VLDKKREISVMKAMGATDGAILRIFLYQGGIIGMVGAGLGLLLGLLVCKGLLVYGFPLDPKVYFISRLPVQVRSLEFLITGEVALAICLEATVLPSLYAANLSPVEGFRDEVGTDEKERWSVSWSLIALAFLNIAAAVLALVQTYTELGPLTPRMILVGRIVLLFFGGVEVWRNLLEGGTQRRMPRVLSGWLLSLHAVNVAVALVAVILLESGSLAGPQRLVLGVIAVGCVIVAVCSLGLRLWKRWGFYGLVALHLVALPVLWLLGPRYGALPFTVTVMSLAFIWVGVRRYWRILD